MRVYTSAELLAAFEAETKRLPIVYVSDDGSRVDLDRFVRERPDYRDVRQDLRADALGAIGWKIQQAGATGAKPGRPPRRTPEDVVRVHFEREADAFQSHPGYIFPGGCYPGGAVTKVDELVVSTPRRKRGNPALGPPDPAGATRILLEAVAGFLCSGSPPLVRADAAALFLDWPRGAVDAAVKKWRAEHGDARPSQKRRKAPKSVKQNVSDGSREAAKDAPCFVGEDSWVSGPSWFFRPGYPRHVAAWTAIRATAAADWPEELAA